MSRSFQTECEILDRARAVPWPELPCIAPDRVEAGASGGESDTSLPGCGWDAGGAFGGFQLIDARACGGDDRAGAGLGPQQQGDQRLQGQHAARQLGGVVIQSAAVVYIIHAGPPPVASKDDALAASGTQAAGGRP